MLREASCHLASATYSTERYKSCMVTNCSPKCLYIPLKQHAKLKETVLLLILIVERMWILCVVIHKMLDGRIWNTNRTIATGTAIYVGWMLLLLQIMVVQGVMGRFTVPGGQLTSLWRSDELSWEPCGWQGFCESVSCSQSAGWMPADMRVCRSSSWMKVGVLHMMTSVCVRVCMCEALPSLTSAQI